MDRNRQTLAGFGLGDFEQPTDDVSPLHGQHIAEPLAGVKRELQRRNEARIRFFAEAFECRIRPRLVALPAAQFLDAEHRIVRPPIAVHREIHQYRHQLKNPVGGARRARKGVAQLVELGAVDFIRWLVRPGAQQQTEDPVVRLARRIGETPEVRPRPVLPDQVAQRARQGARSIGLQSAVDLQNASGTRLLLNR